MAMRRPMPTQAEIDEAFMQEWLEWGFKELEAFLAHHAEYESWCIAHHREAN
jgi:hypothetical protein